MTRKSSRAGALAVLFLGAGAPFAFFACEGNAVIIGIAAEDADTAILQSTSTGSATPAPTGSVSLAADSGLDTVTLLDAAPVACLSDGGCPSGGQCMYLIDAGCGAIGECVSSIANPPVPPSVPPPAPPTGPNVVEARAIAREGYTLTPLVCTEPSADAAAGDAETADSDARDD